ncbi:MAG: M20/M25/M40 family metallo-hydrolase [Blastocatellia bacterium]|nr:M20/M25/M40 family metallo-hydrolase [Blastocatellia bacterium]MBK6424821.1 M20/M25/M40 family metallo-hydrolase [Blastocatellia bacterium]
MPRATGSMVDGAAPDVASVLGRPDVTRAFAWIDGSLDALTSEHIELSEIEAPPFGEALRAERVRDLLRNAGLDDVTVDEVGNVIGTRAGQTSESAIVLSAHLDTVFPAGTDCRVQRTDDRLYGPGIADDGCGLIAMIAVARALVAGDVQTRRPIRFVATVGEEGDGDLRGCRHYFASPQSSARVAAFISLDGPGTERITHRALGSRRFEVHITGPGGHSWGDFGVVNPIHAIGRVIARMSTYPVPLEPRTSFSVGVVSGGTSVNAIPADASCRVDLRSVSDVELARIEQYLRDAVAESVADENRIAAASGTVLEVAIRPIGDRPSGETPATAAIVSAAVEASQVLGIRTVLDCASTDSNIPISLGLPAVTLGGGGSGGGTHTLEEWYDPAGRDLGIKRALLLVVALADAPDGSSSIA